MGQLVANTNENLPEDLQVAHTNVGAWGAPEVETSDVIIPKILLMQKMSDLVDKELAKEGDFVDSLTGEVLGNAEKPIEVIPFHREKVWFVSRMEGGKWILDEIVGFDRSNEKWRYNETVSGVEYKRELHMRFYVLRADDLSIPYIVSFKSMSLASGKALYTQMYVKNRAAGKVPPAKVIELTNVKKENDKGKFRILGFNVGRDSNPEEVHAAFEWFKAVNAGSTKAHEEEEPVEAPAYHDDNSQF